MTVVVDNGVLCITEQQQGRPCGLPVVADVKLQPVKETTEDDYHEDADGTTTEVRQLSPAGDASSSPSSRLEEEKLPLHEALREFAVESLFCGNALLEKNIQRLVDEFPESVTAFDSKGYTPLHIACKEGAPLNVIHTLVGAWPDSVKWPTFNKKKMLPLHLVCRYYSGRNLQKSQVIHFLLRTYPAAVKVTTQAGELPLHLCLQNYFCTLEDLRLLLCKYPGALQMPTIETNKLRLHIACEKQYM